jgi:iron complex transport system permease protein
VKVTVDLDALVAEGKLSAADAEKLRGHAGKETVSTALSALVTVGVLAVVASIVALVHDPATTMALGGTITVVGLAASAQLEESGWGALRQTLLVVGALLLGAGFLWINNGSTIAWVVTAVALLIEAYLTGSGLVGVLAAIAVGPLLNAMMGYMHAAYFIMVQRPLETIAAYGALAWLTFMASKRVPDKNSRPLITYSRTCLFLAQFGFWVGSLWGDPVQFGGRSGGVPRIAPGAFAIGWAAAMLAVGYWAAVAGRRWVVNLCAVFLMINFYTQWFEHLHASPTSLLVAGLVTLAVGLGLRKYNKS